MKMAITVNCKDEKILVGLPSTNTIHLFIVNKTSNHLHHFGSKTMIDCLMKLFKRTVSKQQRAIKFLRHLDVIERGGIRFGGLISIALLVLLGFAVKFGYVYHWFSPIVKFIIRKLFSSSSWVYRLIEEDKKRTPEDLAGLMNEVSLMQNEIQQKIKTISAMIQRTG